MLDYYDKSGKPIDMWEFARLHSDHEYKRIGYDEIGNKRVSTVWLGLNHAIFPETPILIFETMVFSGVDNWEDEHMQRYTTEEQAIAGHSNICEILKVTEEF